MAMIRPCGYATMTRPGVVLNYLKPTPLKPTTGMKPIAEMPEDVRAQIRGVFLDIDDTLSTDGHLTAEAYAALGLA